MLDAGDVGFQPICRSWCEWTRDPWKSGNPCIQRFVSGRQDISLLIRWKSIQKQKTQIIEGLFLFMYFFVRSMLPRFKEYLLHSMWWTLQTFFNLEVLLSVPPFMLYFFFSWTFPSCLHHLHLPPKCCLPTECKLPGAVRACWCSLIKAAFSNLYQFFCCHLQIWYRRFGYCRSDHCRSEYCRSDYCRTDYYRSDYCRSDYYRYDYYYRFHGVIVFDLYDFIRGALQFSQTTNMNAQLKN